MAGFSMPKCTPRTECGDNRTGGPGAGSHLFRQDVRLAPGGAELCLDPPSQDGLWVLLMAPTPGPAMGTLLSPRVSGTVPSHGSSWEKGTHPGVSQET